MQRIKKQYCIFIIFAIYLCIGQLSEVKEQTLSYGDYIQQLAIIHIINGSKDYYMICPDCKAYITVKKISDNSIIISDKNMTLLDTGLFGYQAFPQDFLPNIPYRALVNTSSISYGSGIVLSEFIINQNISGSKITDSLSNLGGILPNNILDGLLDILNTVWDNSFGRVISNFVYAFNNDFLGIKSSSSGITNFINSIINIFSPIITILVNFLKWLINGIIWWVNLLFEHPLEFAILSILSNILIPISIFIIPIIIIEFLILLYVLLKNENNNLNIFNFVGGITEAHWNILKFIGSLISGGINTLRNIKTGIIGDAV
jgi:hypothetical protein